MTGRPAAEGPAGRDNPGAGEARPAAAGRPVSQLRGVDEQLRTVLADLRLPEPIELALLDAQGLLCAEDVLADAPLPGFDNSAMDGYAVRAADTAGATEQDPVVLPVVGDIPAGSRAPRGVTRGICLRIMTGAPMPSGADSIVPVEWTDGGVARVRIHRPAEPGRYVRRLGEDIRTGQLAVRSGTPIGPAQVGLLAAVGRERVLVRPRPRVVVLSTGSELVDVGRRPGSGEILDSNSYALAAAARDAGAEVYRAGIVPDDHARLLSVLEGQLLRADLIVTSGGVSAGCVRRGQGGAQRARHGRVRQGGDAAGHAAGLRHPRRGGHPDLLPARQPGQRAGQLRGLRPPGGPADARQAPAGPPHRPATTLKPVSSPAGRRQYRRGLLHREAAGGYSVEPVGGTGSHLLAGLAQANCLIVIDEEVTEVSEGDQVTVAPLLLASP